MELKNKLRLALELFLVTSALPLLLLGCGGGGGAPTSGSMSGQYWSDLTGAGLRYFQPGLPGSSIAATAGVVTATLSGGGYIQTRGYKSLTGGVWDAISANNNLYYLTPSGWTASQAPFPVSATSPTTFTAECPLLGSVSAVIETIDLSGSTIVASSAVPAIDSQGKLVFTINPASAKYARDLNISATSAITSTDPQSIYGTLSGSYVTGAGTLEAGGLAGSIGTVTITESGTFTITGTFGGSAITGGTLITYGTGMYGGLVTLVSAGSGVSGSQGNLSAEPVPASAVYPSGSYEYAITTSYSGTTPIYLLLGDSVLTTATGSSMPITAEHFNAYGFAAHATKADPICAEGMAWVHKTGGTYEAYWLTRNAGVASDARITCQNSTVDAAATLQGTYDLSFVTVNGVSMVTFSNPTGDFATYDPYGKSFIAFLPVQNTANLGAIFPAASAVATSYVLNKTAMDAALTAWGVPTF